MPGPAAQHTRGYVRSVVVEPTAGRPSQLQVELRLNDARNVEQYCRWRAEHYLGKSLVDALEIRHGDDVEVSLVTDSRGRPARGSYVVNHTRDLRYTLGRQRTGCLVAAAAAAVAALLTRR